MKRHRGMYHHNYNKIRLWWDWMGEEGRWIESISLMAENKSFTKKSTLHKLSICITSPDLLTDFAKKQIYWPLRKTLMDLNREENITFCQKRGFMDSVSAHHHEIICYSGNLTFKFVVRDYN